jgi:2-polyprenyl-3-methyl-5-hydroxy-6-metoxy-1,4-benzoquinol methylase
MTQVFDPSRLSFLGLTQPEPSLAFPTSQLCTESQLREPLYADWCSVLKQAPLLQRKQWEWVYTLQVLTQDGMLSEGRRGLGFGCGKEPLAAAMAQLGCNVVATDLAAATAAGHGWIETDQHATALEDLNERGVCDVDRFRERVQFRSEDMNAISPDLEGFDFVWSSCAFEHLGSIAHGVRFVENAMRCLAPGGIAVHTTEFNLTSNYQTVESRDLVIFRKHDIEHLIRRLQLAGHEVFPLNLNPGSRELDRHVDLPPYKEEQHLRLLLDRYVITSLGLIVRRARS